MLTFPSFVKQVLDLPQLSDNQKLTLAVCKTDTYYNCLSSTLLVTYTLSDKVFTVTDSNATGQGNTLQDALDNLYSVTIDNLVLSLN